MTFDQIKVASDAYPDGLVEQYWDEKRQRIISKKDRMHVSDGLAEFIAVELFETFDFEASDEDQINEAVRVMDLARHQVVHVCAALENLELAKR